MKRTGFIIEISKHKGMNCAKARQAVNAVMDTIRTALINGDGLKSAALELLLLLPI